MPTADLTCQQCGQAFRARQRSDKPRRYCSRACRDAALTTRVRLVCRQCGETFQRKAYQEAWSRERGPFCSMQCYGAWQKGRQGPRPKPSGRYSMTWEENRRRVLDRDGHRCVACGSTHLLHVHHRAEWDPADQATHALDNLETRCAGCHRRAHPLAHGPDGRFLPRAPRPDQQA
jgi:5-methylcytosine-specific restriction endonuclease McrA